MTKPRRSERLRYWFDNWMSRGTFALMLLLALITLVFIIVMAGIVILVQAYPADDPTQGSFWDLVWGNLMRTIDSGAMGGDTGWGYRILMLVVTIGGLLVTASLIGIVTEAFGQRVEELRKGRSRVLESDHTLILGWSSKVFPIIHELSIANESRRRAVIVVLADRDKVEMEDALRAQVGSTGHTRVVVRTGDPMNLHDLELGAPHDARSIILLGDESDDDPDSGVIKMALALTNNPNRKQGAYHIVGELRNAANVEAARLVGKDEAHWVLASELIGRVTVQTCRQSGLSVVYTELLDFEGVEMYFTEQPSLVGQTYGQTQTAFADSAVMGIVTPDAVLINPPSDTVYQAGDQLLVIAEDDSTIHLAAAGPVDESAIAAPASFTQKPERTVVLGVNSGLATMLTELDGYVATGSTAIVVTDGEEPDLPKLAKLAVTVHRGDPTSRALLDSLDLATSSHIIVLADRENLPVQRADARTLITLLHLRDIGDRLGVDLNVVSEMLDDRNRELAEVTKADDFIVSDKLVSLMLSQVSENKRLTDVFATLFSSQGSELYLRPAELYVRGEADFYTVLEAARRRGETAIGYRIAADAQDADKAYGVVVNPGKAGRLTFRPGDKVIVLAES